MENKIFILGIGAQKSGTTWLHDYLKQHPNCDLGFEKEYHVFDALHLKNQSTLKDILQARINRVVNSKNKPTTRDVLLLRFLGNTNIYFRYFQSLVKNKPDIKLTGDITPSYAALSQEVYANIKQQIIQHGFKAKVIFVMRDPVERCISLSRMLLKKANLKLSTTSETDHLKQNFMTEDYVIRTRYDLTINNVEAVFDSNEIHYTFYEELFTETSIKSLCDFLEIQYIEPDFNHQPNKSRTNNEIPESLKREIADFYRPVYDFTAAKFGDKKIKTIWDASKFLNTQSH